MIKILLITGSILGIIVSIITITKFILPSLKNRKLRRFFELVQGWFDEIDKNLETGVNLSILNNIENRITSYLEDNHLNKYKINISNRFIKKYLAKFGLKKELQNNMDLFFKYSRCDSREITLKDFWISLMGNFMKYHSSYKNGKEDYNFANIEMRVKFLKQYLKIKDK